MISTPVRQETLGNGRYVSTVEIPYPAFVDADGTFFETMVFPSEEDFLELEGGRCKTREEALALHTAMVLKWGLNES